MCGVAAAEVGAAGPVLLEAGSAEGARAAGRLRRTVTTGTSRGQALQQVPGRDLVGHAGLEFALGDDVAQPARVDPERVGAAVPDATSMLSTSLVSS